MVAAVSLGAFGLSVADAATTTVGLGTASSFAVLAGSTITNTGSSVIAGDIGLSPGTAVTGFPPGAQSSGVTDVNNALAAGAQTDLTTAYNDAASRTPFTTVTADLGGTTLVPGVYRSSTSLSLTGAVTLNGGGNTNAVFVFQAGSTLTSAPGSTVVLENGAQACNVFWQVGSSATLGTTSNFAGTIMALTSITLDTGASVSGRALARNGAVTLDDNSITVPSCSVATTTTTNAPTTTTTVAPTTTTTVAPTTTTTVAPTTTTTRPVTTTTSPTTTTTGAIPSGSPGTGFGGTAGSGSSPLVPFGLSALALSFLFGLLAVRARRRRIAADRGSTDDTPDGA
ncbi:MAG: ice-binding family protein [Acidimicrobiales bacterium]